MSTLLNDMVNKGYTKKEVLDVLYESEEEKERRRVSAIVTKAIDVIRLENVRIPRISTASNLEEDEWL